MTALKKSRTLSVEDYLAGELVSSVKHEYLAGAVHAMAGGTVTHQRISTNTTVSLGSRLRNKKCEAFNSDMKVRIQFLDYDYFYYPDVSVVCDSNTPQDSVQDQPRIVIEVTSPSTKRIDEGEKKDAYLTLASLVVYIILAQDSPSALVYRRGPKGFVQENYEGLEAIIPLPEIETELPLAEAYARVEFLPEATDEESIG